jgi:hypothetical protein
MTDHAAPVTVATRRQWASAIHPVLFAAYPVLFLWSQNLGEADLSDVIPTLLVLCAVAAVLTVLLGVLMRDVRRAALVLSPLIIALLMYGHVARLVRPLHIPTVAQQAGWVALVLVATVVALRLSRPALQRVGTALTRVAALLIVVTLIAIVPFQLTNQTAGASSASESSMATSTTAKKRDVYWFIFDRYGSDHALDLLYGIQNDLTPWLRDQGFTVIDDAHANYVKTSLSIATTNQMTHLRDLPNTPAPSEKSQAFLSDAVKSSAVARQFKALGYRFVNIGSWWAPDRSSPLADVNLHTPGPSEFTASLIEASALPGLQRRLGLREANPRTRHWENNQYGLDAASRVSDEPGPKYVYTHILLPHPPYVHATDGHFLTDEEMEGRSSKQLFEDQLAYANSRIKEIIGGLLDVPEDERPIIILQADEGPETNKYRATRDTTWDWTTATTDDVETKFGILNAWYLPPGVDVGLYPGQTSINTFPLLFRDYFGLDYDLREDRVFGSRHYGTPYDLVELTDKLDDAQ